MSCEFHLNLKSQYIKINRIVVYQRHIIKKYNFKNSHSLLTNIVKQLQINPPKNTLDLYGTQKYYKILLKGKKLNE